VLGPVEQLERGRLLHDLAGVHDRHVVRRLRHDTHVVGDEEHRHPALAAQVVEQVEHLRLHGDVERGRRLVGDEQPRLAGDRHGDAYALAHAAGKTVRVVVEALERARDADLGEQLARPPARGAALEAEVALQDLDDLRPDRERRVERGHRVLEDHPDLAPAHVLELPLGELGQLTPVEADGAGDDPGWRRGEEAHDRERGDGLPAARLADEAQRASALDGEADAVDGMHDALAREEVRPQVRDLEQRHRQVSFVRGSRASRRPSAMKLAQRTRVAMARLGMMMMCGWAR
jgi:hypothetical protein